MMEMGDRGKVQDKITGGEVSTKLKLESVVYIAYILTSLRIII